MSKSNYYASTTLVGWRPVVFGPNDEPYQIRTNKDGKLYLRPVSFSLNVFKYLQGFIKTNVEEKIQNKKTKSKNGE